MFDGTTPNRPLNSQPDLSRDERGAVRRALAIACIALALAGTASTLVAMNARPDTELAFLGP